MEITVEDTAFSAVVCAHRCLFKLHDFRVLLLLLLYGTAAHGYSSALGNATACNRL